MTKRRKVKDISGQKFGRLTAIKHVGYRRKYALWECKCDCGADAIVLGSDLRRGNTQSCGCLSIDKSSEAHRIHGMDGTPTYKSWISMKTRCYAINDSHYKNYGGRGITVCDRWRNSFKNFLKDMGERPIGTSIDRIDNDKGYSPENCQWATPKEQSRNQRRNRIITYEGETMCLANWAEKLGIKYETLRSRLARHSLQKAFDPY